MRVGVTGSSGLVGRSLLSRLDSEEREVIPIVREPNGDDRSVVWDLKKHHLESERLSGIDAIIHLAGENIATGRWSTAKKSRIRASRVEGTEFLCESLANLPNRPKVLVAASATGYYGDRGSQECPEITRPGRSFLAEVCRDWEGATAIAAAAGIRVVNLRIGIVLSPQGGALKKMLLPFRLGMGGRVGNGQQYWSWIGLPDLIEVILHAVETEGLAGPVNVVAPNPVTNREFTKLMGRVLRRPTLIPVPGFAVRMALGEMADELLLTSTRATPQKLLRSGFRFENPTLEDALRTVLNR